MFVRSHAIAEATIRQEQLQKAKAPDAAEAVDADTDIDTYEMSYEHFKRLMLASHAQCLHRTEAE